LKAEWLAAFVEAHENAFITRNIKAGFHGTGIVPFDPSKVLSRIKSVINECVEVRSVTSIDSATSSIESIFTSSPLNTDDFCSVNAVLRSQLGAGGVFFTPLRDYATCEIRRSERQQARITIIEEQQKSLQAAMTKRKAI